MTTIFERVDRFDRPLVPTQTAYTSASTAAVPLRDASIKGAQVVYLEPSTDCHVVFGDASVRAATTSDFRLFAGEIYRLQFSNDSNNLRVIRNSADGSLGWFVAGAT
jgi:hypothetical protein